MLGERGVDLAYGRKLPRLIRAAGLNDVTATAYFPVAEAASRMLEAANVEQVAGALIAAGHATRAEIDAHLDAVASGALDIATPPLISAAGRRS